MPRTAPGGCAGNCRHRHALCRANLAEAETVSVAADMRLLAAQRRIDGLLDGQPAAPIGS